MQICSVAFFVSLLARSSIFCQNIYAVSLINALICIISSFIYQCDKLVPKTEKKKKKNSGRPYSRTKITPLMVAFKWWISIHLNQFLRDSLFSCWPINSLNLLRYIYTYYEVCACTHTLAFFLQNKSTQPYIGGKYKVKWNGQHKILIWREKETTIPTKTWRLGHGDDNDDGDSTSSSVVRKNVRKSHVLSETWVAMIRRYKKVFALGLFFEQNEQISKSHLACVFIRVVVVFHTSVPVRYICCRRLRRRFFAFYSFCQLCELLTFRSVCVCTLADSLKTVN